MPLLLACGNASPQSHWLGPTSTLQPRLLSRSICLAQLGESITSPTNHCVPSYCFTTATGDSSLRYRRKIAVARKIPPHSSFARPPGCVRSTACTMKHVLTPLGTALCGSCLCRNPDMRSVSVYSRGRIPAALPRTRCKSGQRQAACLLYITCQPLKPFGTFTG